ncbi:protein-serine O-palmitoleoyltransferase porcupine-like [Corticium candelabrum]|uniref:protein-serine O-palmitoleoyltransferase porcupine-like n=1 Tax=Corticium candelabrum TaxID=121492 RepID=UPI002E2571E1|nr:protein-serine O-palmitoleoyltransferase porcupine-like [Corticium candelabrum]
MDSLRFFAHCFWSTTNQTLDFVLPLFALCLVVRSVCLLGAPPIVRHLASLVAGLAVIRVFVQEKLPYFVVLALVGYSTLLLAPTKRKGVFSSLLCVSFIMSCELVAFTGTEWHQIRGSIMIVAMKTISIGFDLDECRLNEIPGIVAFSGFVLSPANSVFGPFVQYRMHLNLLDDRPLSRAWFYRLVRCLALAAFALSFSMCFWPWVFQRNSHKWLLAFTTAASFRYSHYFVSYLSEATSVMCGIGFVDTESGGHWGGVTVARMEEVEMPRSLVEVVTSWNMASHLFLKSYVYKPSRSLGIFPAIVITYLASALLHGLNFQLSAVLLSIGFYAYIENVVRNKLAKKLNASVVARRLVSRDDLKYKETVWWVTIINMLFSALAVFHLAYLGAPFDLDSAELQEQGYSMQHTVGRWRDLSFASHWVALATLLAGKVI